MHIAKVSINLKLLEEFYIIKLCLHEMTIACTKLYAVWNHLFWGQITTSILRVFQSVNIPLLLCLLSMTCSFFILHFFTANIVLTWAKGLLEPAQGRSMVCVHIILHKSHMWEYTQYFVVNYIGLEMFDRVRIITATTWW